VVRSSIRWIRSFGGSFVVCLFLWWLS
jgi:hypothetical protein